MKIGVRFWVVEAPFIFHVKGMRTVFRMNVVRFETEQPGLTIITE